MQTVHLKTNNSRVNLVKPNVGRDAPHGVNWLEGDAGRDTLKLMGVSDGNNKPSSLHQEQQRIQDFITNIDHLNWMIAYDTQIVGAIWVDLKASGHLPGPSIHVMIGDPNSRGKGIGMKAMEAVIRHLRIDGAQTIYSRYITDNKGSEHLLSNLEFHNLGGPYLDKDGLRFQNVILKLAA